MKEMYTEPNFELIRVLGKVDVITESIPADEDWGEEGGDNPLGPDQG